MISRTLIVYLLMFTSVQFAFGQDPDEARDWKIIASGYGEISEFFTNYSRAKDILSTDSIILGTNRSGGSGIKAIHFAGIQEVMEITPENVLNFRCDISLEIEKSNGSKSPLNFSTPYMNTSGTCNSFMERYRIPTTNLKTISDVSGIPDTSTTTKISVEPDGVEN